MCYHLCREIDIRSCITWPVSSGKYSDIEINPRVCNWVVAMVFLKIGLIFSCQRQIRDLKGVKESSCQMHLHQFFFSSSSSSSPPPPLSIFPLFFSSF